MLNFHSANFILFASHLDALNLSSSSSLGDAAHLVRWAADWAAFSQICLCDAVDVVVAFALVASGGVDFDTVARSGVSGGDVIVDRLRLSDSGDGESEKFHFFVLLTCQFISDEYSSV